MPDTATLDHPEQAEERKENFIDDTAGPADPDVGKRSLFQRKPWLRIVVILVALVLVIGGIAFYIHSRHWESTDDAQVDGHIYNISARVSGHVTKVNFDDNQVVKAGDILVEIDPADYQVALAKAEADYQDSLAQAQAARSGIPIARAGAQTNIASAQADVTNAQASITAAQKQADAARAQLAQAQANAVKANNDVARYQQLIQKQEISQQQFDTVVANAKGANAAVDAAQAQVLASEQQIAVTQGRLLQSRANLSNANVGPANVTVTSQRANAAGAGAQRAQAALDQARLNLQYTKIAAPINGIVGHRSVEAGHNISAGQMLMSVVPTDENCADCLWITANFKETQLHKMRAGQSAKVHVDALDLDIQGKVDSIGAATGAVFSMLPPENATGNYVKVVQRIPVKITYAPDQDPRHLLRPGMSVEADVNVE